MGNLFLNSPLVWEKMELKKEDYINIINNALEEDVKDGDITSESIIPKDSMSKASLISKDDGIVCGIQVFMDTMQEPDPNIKFIVNFKDGDKVKKGDTILNIEGRTRSILKSERVALNFIQRMSGIATKTYRYVSKIKDYKTKILDTRKTLPCFRKLDKYAVFIGGGKNHRMGLYDMFLIKENHIKAVSEISVAVTRARNFMKDIKVEVETTNLDEVKEACLSGADRIMLDNMDNETITKASNIVKDHNKKKNINIEIEVSGNITEERLISLAEIGIDYISMGELTHSVKAFDLSLIID
jgi:nicotinate-nucleotide pyrophosphorylase (carboxylating)